MPLRSGPRQRYQSKSAANKQVRAKAGSQSESHEPTSSALLYFHAANVTSTHYRVNDKPFVFDGSTENLRDVSSPGLPSILLKSEDREDLLEAKRWKSPLAKQSEFATLSGHFSVARLAQW
jgi:hypothetical protein